MSPLSLLWSVGFLQLFQKKSAIQPFMFCFVLLRYTHYPHLIGKCVLLTSIEEKDEIGDINIYPNPFTSQTNINFSEYQNNSTIKILDLQGKVIKSINFSGKEFELDKDAMQAGMYLMQVTDDKQNFTSKKILIQ